MGAENKRSVYINDNNMELLNSYVKKNKKKSLSYWLNKIIEIHRTVKRFTIKDNKAYIPVQISLKAELVELLEQLEVNYGVEAVIRLVNHRLLEEFANQTGHTRYKYPHMALGGDRYIDNAIDTWGKRCKNFLDFKR